MADTIRLPGTTTIAASGFGYASDDVSSADRTITGPVIIWMIQNKVAFMNTANPYALGGLIGSIFFAGYMLTQFPGGYAGANTAIAPWSSSACCGRRWRLADGLAAGLIAYRRAHLHGLG